MKQYKDLTGRKFGRWKVLGEGKHKYYGKYKVLYWKCKCKCGIIKDVHGGNLISEKSQSCGCLHVEMKKAGLRLSHGMSGTSIYETWCRMINRCYNKSGKDWNIYGGRGIEVCDRWHYSFENFFADMGYLYKKGLAIDRKNNDGNYEPKNCRWATQKQQQRNRGNNHNITFKGKTQCIAAWAEELGIKISTLGMRLTTYGWPVERALTMSIKGAKTKTI